MGRGFGGMPGNMSGLMKQAQKMQEQIQKTQESLEAYLAEGTSGGGAVKVVCSGTYEVTALEMKPETLDPNDREMTQELIRTAVNDALKKVKDHQKAEMAKVTGGMNIPGLM